MKIIYEDKDTVIVEKPVGLPCEAKSGETVCTVLCEQCGFPVYLIHRLDKEVGGVIVFAKNKKAAAYYSNELQNGVFIKEYLAVTDGIPEEPEGVLKDLLFKDSGKMRSYVVKRMRKGVKEASLEYKVLEVSQGKALLKIKLHTGRTHQIRVQFSSRRLPLCGDRKYGSHDEEARIPSLRAAKLTLRLFGGEVRSFYSLPESEKYPWALFTLLGVKEAL